MNEKRISLRFQTDNELDMKAWELLEKATNEKKVSKNSIMIELIISALENENSDDALAEQIAELVVHDALQIRVMAQDGADVGHGILDGAIAFQIQLCLPVIVLFEILLRLCRTILRQRFLYARVLHRKVAHSLVRRQLAGRCVG